MIQVAPNAKEILLKANDLIVSKTNLSGKITYANRQFMRISDFPEYQLLGKDHNIIRHCDMPAGVFYGLWETLKAGREFFGFIKNITAQGDYYWVFANITPDLLDGKKVGFFSVRRYAPDKALKAMTPIYEEMLKIEKATNKNSAPAKSWSWLQKLATSKDFHSYDEYIISLYEQHV